MRFGWTEERFWSATPAELSDYLSEYQKIQESEIYRTKAASWWTAMLSRSQKIPAFDAWMNNKPDSRALKGEEAEERKQEFDDFASRIAKLQEEGELSLG